jgi:hypothetical protein
VERNLIARVSTGVARTWWKALVVTHNFVIGWFGLRDPCPYRAVDGDRDQVALGEVESGAERADEERCALAHRDRDERVMPRNASFPLCPR